MGYAARCKLSTSSAFLTGINLPVEPLSSAGMTSMRDWQNGCFQYSSSGTSFRMPWMSFCSIACRDTGGAVLVDVYLHHTDDYLPGSQRLTLSSAASSSNVNTS
jgi:hypothetical protein